MADQSIHPRIAGGRQQHEKVNTRGIASPERRARVIASLKTHLVRRPRDGVRAQHLARLEKVAP